MIGAPFGEAQVRDRPPGGARRAGLHRAGPHDGRADPVGGGQPASQPGATVRAAGGQSGAPLGQAETSVYPSSAWRPGRAGGRSWRVWKSIRRCRPGEYRLDGGFTVALGAGPDRGRWCLGQRWPRAARGPSVRLVSRSAPLAVDSLTLDRRIDAQLDGARLVGVDFDRDALRAGERVRVTLYWESTSPRPEPREITLNILVARRPGSWPDPSGVARRPRRRHVPHDRVEARRDRPRHLGRDAASQLAVRPVRIGGRSGGAGSDTEHSR